MNPHRAGTSIRSDGVHFRCWAPKAKRVDVILEPEGTAHALTADGAGIWSGTVADARAGMTYRYRLDGSQSYPDPRSRCQPQGPHGASLIVDPTAYKWNDQRWSGVTMHGQVIYELHIGTFTSEGTFEAAVSRLDSLKALGVTVIEMMPIADFPGRWNWGYDGVCLFAPSHVYGTPTDLKRFVEEAHRRGLAVILDVVYNHLGPDGNYLGAFSEHYITSHYFNDWGDAIDFDGPHSSHVREFFIDNACYWIDEFHFDGLRLDALHTLYDKSSRHLIAELSQAARQAAGARRIILIAECEAQWMCTIEPLDRQGWGLDAIWSEDFHHAAHVAATGRRETYFGDYWGTPQELISCVKRGFLYQGQWSHKQGKPRGGIVTHHPAEQFVFFLQNHDQVGNQLHGDRLHQKTSPGLHRALTALLLLSPETPMLFMGQEFGASAPFLFFTDFPSATLAKQVYDGRKSFVAQFFRPGSGDDQVPMPDPSDVSVFERSKIDWSEQDRHFESYRLHKDLLRLRREDPVIAQQARERVDGAVIGTTTFVLRYADDRYGDRLLLFSLGTELDYRPAPEPLLAPPEGRTWICIWSSNASEYGGPGIREALTETGWVIPHESAALYIAREN